MAISPQLVSHSREFREKVGLEFDVLSDPGSRTAERYGLTFRLPAELRELYLQFGIDLEAYNGDDSWVLPIPARILVDREGVIRSVDADPDYTVRPEPADTVERLRRLVERE